MPRTLEGAAARQVARQCACDGAAVRVPLTMMPLRSIRCLKSGRQQEPCRPAVVGRRRTL